MKDLHTYGLVFDTAWVTIHDTETDGFTPFDSNALAKLNNATPFKRPENGMFRPKTKFTEFFFTETGDTNALTEAGEDHGGFGALFQLVQSSASADTGQLNLFFLCDLEHTGLDNLAFLSDRLLIAVEDAGDTLHGQRNAFDSAYLFDTTADYSNPSTQPVRILAQGRDASATLDSSLGSVSGFQNDGDNEITGIHVSDGDATVRGVLASKSVKALSNDESEHAWRVFYTQQHGDNVTYEILRASQSSRN
jgi:secreted PhoX family phosphatase